MLELHLPQRLPVALAGAGIEELDARVSDAESSVRIMQIVLHVQEEAAELIFRDLIG